MEMAIKRLPANPNDAYKQVIARIKEAGSHTSVIAIQTLTWIFHAARPLLVDELCEVLYLKDEHDRTNVDWELNIIDIIEICQSLIVHEESSGIIRFIHPTVQEYLKSVELSPVVNLAKTCLNYLMNDAFNDICLDEKSMEIRVQKYRFCLYAAQFWGFHVRGDAELCPWVEQSVFRLLASETRRDSVLQMERWADSIWDRLSFIRGQTVLHIIAQNGLTTLCNRFLKGQPRHAIYISDRTNQ